MPVGWDDKWLGLIGYDRTLQGNCAAWLAAELNRLLRLLESTYAGSGRRHLAPARLFLMPRVNKDKAGSARDSGCAAVKQSLQTRGAVCTFGCSDRD